MFINNEAEAGRGYAACSVLFRELAAQPELELKLPPPTARFFSEDWCRREWVSSFHSQFSESLVEPNDGEIYIFPYPCIILESLWLKLTKYMPWYHHIYWSVWVVSLVGCYINSRCSIKCLLTWLEPVNTHWVPGQWGWKSSSSSILMGLCPCKISLPPCLPPFQPSSTSSVPDMLAAGEKAGIIAHMLWTILGLTLTMFWFGFYPYWLIQEY